VKTASLTPLLVSTISLLGSFDGYSLNIINMSPILRSATRLTLLMLIVALIILTFLGKVDEETFKTVIVMVVSYYF